MSANLITRPYLTMHSMLIAPVVVPESATTLIASFRPTSKVEGKCKMIDDEMSQDGYRRFDISNKWIWLMAVVPWFGLVKLYSHIEFGKLDFLSWVLLGGIFGGLPLVAGVYRARIFVGREFVVLRRWVVGGIWLTEKRIGPIDSVEFPEENLNGRVVARLKNGRKLEFDPRTGVRDLFFRKVGPRP